MWKIVAIGIAIVILLACTRVALPVTASGANAAGAPEPAQELAIEFDYRKIIEQNIRGIADGKPDEAMEALSKGAPPNWFAPAASEDLKKRFAAIFANGKLEEFEVIGYRRLSSWDYKFYAVANFGRASVLFGYAVHRIDGAWKLTGYSLSDQYDEFDKLQPIQRLAPVKAK